MRSSFGRGCIRSLERYLFSFEIVSNASRQIPVIEKLHESLLDCQILPFEGRDFFVSQTVLLKSLERCSLPSKEKKKWCSKVKKRPPTQSEIWDLLLVLNQSGVPWDFALGIQFGSGGPLFSEEWIRAKHVLGLADSIHMAMFNMDVNVRFPRPVFRQTSDMRRAMYRGSPPEHMTNGLNRGSRLRRDFFRFRMKGIVLQRPNCDNRRFRLVLWYLRRFPKRQEEKRYVKLIKQSLVHTFCVQAGQELPKTAPTIPLFPEVTQRALDKKFSTCRREKVRFYKNLLESKSLCAEVGDDMVDEAYEEHRKSLCRPAADCLRVSEENLKKLYSYGKSVGRFISSFYNPYETSLPNTRATVEHSRQKGGARESLKSRMEVSVGPLYVDMLKGACRPEPFVIGLFGPPGSGKTTNTQKLVRMFGSSLFRNVKGDDLVYSRSCQSQHWDGYHGQPIVVLDDFGQGLDDRSDLVEFEQLVSVNRYQLPMADLSEKGKVFTSPIIIVTSNMAYGSRIRDATGKSRVVEDDIAVWRRFHLPFYVSKVADQTLFRRYRSELLTDHHMMKCFWAEKFETARSTSNEGYGFSKKLNRNHHYLSCFGGVTDDSQILDPPFELTDVILLGLEEFHTHVNFHVREFSSGWRQDIFCGEVSVKQGEAPFYNVNVRKKSVAHLENDVTISQVFDTFPPYHPPVVEAIAIKEPLKVRMITKAESCTKCLQPLQRALFAYLKSQPQFVLTHGMSWGNSQEFDEKLEWIYKIESEIRTIRDRFPGEDHLWLSGDYTAATDNFPKSVTDSLVEGILSEIDHEPTKRWVRYEVSSHRIRYPGGIVGDQTSGQLMGSLLSFPLLCFLNDFTLRESGFKEGSYLINGDDVVAKGLPEQIDRWRGFAPTVGLDLSLGKNFIDPDFCTVNSQLFWRGDVQHTGKVSLQTRYGKTLSRCFAEMEFYYGERPELEREFIRRNLLELRKTPRSLRVPLSHGGLGMNFKRTADIDHKLAKTVYLHDYLLRIGKSDPVPGFDFLRAVHVPVTFADSEDDKEESLPGVKALADLGALHLDPPEVDDCELTHDSLGKIKNILSDHPELWNKLQGHALRDYPPLGELRTKVLFVQKGKVGFIKKRCLEMALFLLLMKIREKPFDVPRDPNLWVWENVEGPVTDLHWDQMDQYGLCPTDFSAIPEEDPFFSDECQRIQSDPTTLSPNLERRWSKFTCLSHDSLSSSYLLRKPLQALEDWRTSSDLPSAPYDVEPIVDSELGEFYLY